MAIPHQRTKTPELRLLPKHHAYLDAVHRFQFLKPEHFQILFGGALNARTLRLDLKKLNAARLLNRARKNKDEEYTYFPPSIREKSPLMLDHTNEITWVQVLLATDAAQHNLEMMALERRPSRIKFEAVMKNRDGIMKSRRCIPDLFAAVRNTAKPVGQDMSCIFWEITNAKPGQHFRKENDIVQKCEAYNAYFDSGNFVDRLQKEFHIVCRNFRVVITFPTELRAQNFIQILKQRNVAYPGRFWITWKEAYRANLYGPIFLSPKDNSLHSICD